MMDFKLDRISFEYANDILLKRRNKLLFINSGVAVSAHGYKMNITEYVMTLNVKLAQLGYRIDSDKCLKLENVTSTPNDIKFIMSTWFDAVKKYTADDVKYVPFYPGFPEEVIDMSKEELIANAILHYWSYGTFFTTDEERQKFLAKYDNQNDFDIIEKIPTCFKLDVVTDLDELDVIFNNLMSSKTSLSEDDKADLDVYFKYFYVPGIDVLPEIPYKENAAYVLSEVFKYHKTSVTANSLRNILKTSTDVLRFYTSLSSGDVSLATPTKFVNLSNNMYKLMLNILDNIPYKNLIEDFYRYPEQWKRIGEKIHPGKYKTKYQNVKKAFIELRSGKKSEKSWVGKVNESFNKNDIDSASKLLIQRPGEFARNIDRLLRNADSEQSKSIMSMFMHIAEKLPVPMLLQLVEHFNDRDKYERIFLPKGGNAKAFVMRNYLEKIDDKYIECLTQVCENAVYYQLMKKDYMGSVYIDPSFEGFVVPYNQRSASASIRPAVRGSRWKISNDIRFIRGFCWWTNANDERIDDDISVILTDTLGGEKKITKMKLINYRNLKYNNCVYHSGDIVDGGPSDGIGATEFIDINIPGCVEEGFRYAIFTINSFTKQHFSQYNSRAGFLELEDNSNLGMSGHDLFDPSKVKMKIDLNSETNSAIAFVVDMHTREVIWLDMVNEANGLANVNLTYNTVLATVRAVVNKRKFTLDELITMNASVRGNIVNTPDKADIIFSLENNTAYGDKTVITPWELDRFMSEYM